MTTLNPTEAGILTGCVSDLLAISLRDFPARYGEAPEKRRIVNAAVGVVACDPSSWLGYSLESPADRMQVSRAYRSLEQRGLVDRIIGNGGRCTHLRITEAGLALQAELDVTFNG